MFEEPGTYDQIITMFSPDGRLLQVEYAVEAVNCGAIVLGVSCLEGIVLGAEEGARAAQDLDFSWKIYEVDEHLGAAVVGLAADARILIDQARIDAQINRLTYDEPIDVEVVTKRIGDIKQLYTQHAGVRPFGVSIILVVWTKLETDCSPLTRVVPTGLTELLRWATDAKWLRPF